MNKKEEKRLASTLPCTNCGTPFYMCPSHRARNVNNFCSRKCNAIFHTGENHKAYQKELHIKNCLICNNEVKRARSKYCSPKCQGIAAKGENSSRYNKEKINCTECKKELMKQPSLVFKTNFCSQKCKNTYHSKRMASSNNPRFKDGVWVGKKGTKGIYNGFTLTIKKQVRKRDGNKCVICSKTDKEHDTAMHVHHIDYNKDNNDLSNLVSVCRYCHGKIHGNEKEWQKILSKA